MIGNAATHALKSRVGQEVPAGLACEFSIKTAPELSRGLTYLGAHRLSAYRELSGFAPKCLMQSGFALEGGRLWIAGHTIDGFKAEVDPQLIVGHYRKCWHMNPPKVRSNITL